MVRVGVRACMRVLVLAVVLILAGCGNSSEPQAQSSIHPSAGPTPIAATPSGWAAPVRIVHQPPYAGNSLEGVSCPSTTLCVATDEAGNVLTSTAPTAGDWTVSH